MKSGRDLCETWLYDHIATVTENIHRAPAPRDAAYPLATITFVGGGDVRNIGAPIGVERHRYQVDVWDVGDDARPANQLATNILSRIDVAQAVQVEGGYVLACRRIMMVPIDHEIDNNITYQRNGAVYQIDVIAKRD